MVTLSVDFEWDLKKELANIRKHGVHFTEASECFQDPVGFAMLDTHHSVTEKRYFWVGRSESHRVLTVRFIRRGEKIRIFGAAEWRKFRELYYERTKAR